MKGLLIVMFGLILGLVVDASVSAEDQKSDKDTPSAEEKFKMIDKDGDQKLSMKEFVDGRPSDQTEKQATAHFTKADVNKDNFLSLVEYKTTSPEKKPEKEPVPSPVL